MFFLIVFFVVGLVLSLFLAPKPKLPNATPGKLSDVNFPRAQEGAPIPRIYGTLKFKAPNTLWDGDFKSVAITKRVATGLFSHKNQTIGFKYYLGMDLGICLGPGFVYRRIWAGNYELWNGCLYESACETVVDINLPNLFGGQDKNGGWSGRIHLYCGSYDQTQNAYLQSKIWPDNSNQVPAYNGIAHMVLEHCYMGNTTSIQPIYVEGSCFPDSLDLATEGTLIAKNALDMNPVGILHHIFTDDWGNLDIDPAKINAAQWKAVAKKIWDEGHGSSLEVANPTQASDSVKELMSQIAATMYQSPSTGLYELVLIRNDYDIEDLVVLGPDEISEVQNFTKVLWSQTYNTVRIKYIDRTQNYKEDVTAMAQDFAQVRYQKKVRPQEIPMQSIYDPDIANMVAARELSNLNVPLYATTLVLNRTGSALPPGTPFVFMWPEYGITSMVMRVRKLGRGTLQNGSITMDVTQDVFSATDVVIAPPIGSPYIPPDTSAQPIIDYEVFELPYWLDYNANLSTLAGQQSAAVFAKAPSVYSIGFNGYIVGTPDAEVFTLSPYTATAELVADLGQYDGFVAGLLPTLDVKVLSNAAILANGDARLGSGMFMLNDELFDYETFTDNLDGTYTLNNVHRALFDTVYTAGAADDVIFFFDGQSGFIDGGMAVGTEYDLKLADVTSSDQYATPAVIPFTPAGRLYAPLPPDGLTIDATRATDSSGAAGGTVTLDWLERNRLTAPTTVIFEDDATQAPEAGTVYKLEVVDGTATVLFTEDDIAATTYDLALTEAMTGQMTLKLWSKIGTVLSFNPAVYPLFVQGPFEIDGDRVTIDGDGIVM